MHIDLALLMPNLYYKKHSQMYYKKPLSNLYYKNHSQMVPVIQFLLTVPSIPNKYFYLYTVKLFPVLLYKSINSI